MTSPQHPAVPLFQGQAELRPTFAPRAGISHVVFDFDGTLSWVRHGWPEIMFAVFRQHWRSLAGETESDRRAVMESIVFGLNGRPTLVQMQHFAERMNARPGAVLEAEALRSEFQERLDAKIAARLAAIRSSRAEPDAYVIFGARPLLKRLRAAGLTLVILSSTIEHRVREEAEALGLAEFFGRHIYGSGADPAAFSKMEVLQRLLHEERIAGGQLLSFGDGPVEIRSTKELGGLAIAVCSDENHNGSGAMDEVKRRQLLEAGADAAIPDFRDGPALVDFLLTP